MLGFAIGRWWTLAAPAAFGVYIAAVEEVEVPGWFLGLGYAALGAVGVAGGLLLRRLAIGR